MQINFTGNGLEITPTLKAFTVDKFDRLVRHVHKITSINVKFDVEKLQQVAEATIHLTQKREVHARAEAPVLYTAIDYLVDKLDRQLIKQKEKLTEHRE